MDRSDKTRRQIVRAAVKKDGNRSSRVAAQLMKLSDAVIRKLELSIELTDTIKRARAIPSQQARRRAERELAGELRHVDIADVSDRIAKVLETGSVETRHLHLAEQWRAKLVEGGIAAAADFPGGPDDELGRHIERARAERDTGKPPGAGRTLFRHIAAILKAAMTAEATDGEGDADADDDDVDGDDTGAADDDDADGEDADASEKSADK